VFVLQDDEGYEGDVVTPDDDDDTDDVIDNTSATGMYNQTLLQTYCHLNAV
jgi:hypothetical protein